MKENNRRQRGVGDGRALRIEAKIARGRKAAEIPHRRRERKQVLAHPASRKRRASESGVVRAHPTAERDLRRHNREREGDGFFWRQQRRRASAATAAVVAVVSVCAHRRANTTTRPTTPRRQANAKQRRRASARRSPSTFPTALARRPARRARSRRFSIRARRRAAKRRRRRRQSANQARRQNSDARVRSTLFWDRAPRPGAKAAAVAADGAPTICPKQPGQSGQPSPDSETRTKAPKTATKNASGNAGKSNWREEGIGRIKRGGGRRPILAKSSPPTLRPSGWWCRCI